MTTTDQELQFAYFDRFTPVYDEDRLRFLERHFKDLPAGAKVLDLGCGDGGVLGHLSSRFDNLTYHGLDPSKEYIARARAKLHGAASLEVGSLLDAESMATLPKDFDAILMVSVLHHLVGKTVKLSEDYASQAITTAASHLAPGGLLAIYEPAIAPELLSNFVYHIKREAIRRLGTKRLELGPRWLNFGAPLVRFYTPERICELLTSSHLEVEAIELVEAATMAGVLRREKVGIVARKAQSTPLFEACEQ